MARNKSITLPPYHNKAIQLSVNWYRQAKASTSDKYSVAKFGKKIAQFHLDVGGDSSWATYVLADNQVTNFVVQYCTSCKKKNRQKKRKLIVEKKKAAAQELVPYNKFDRRDLSSIMLYAMGPGRNDPNVSEFISNSLTALLIHHQQFVESEEFDPDVHTDNFIKHGIPKLSSDEITRFLDDPEMSKYYHGALYVGVCSGETDIQKYKSNLAMECLRQVAINLGLGYAQLMQKGAISGCLLSCVEEGVASTAETEFQTLFQGAPILAPDSPPTAGQLCVISLQKQHDAGQNSGIPTEGNLSSLHRDNKPHHVFLLLLPNHAVDPFVQVKNQGTFAVSYDYLDEDHSPTGVVAPVPIPQGFGTGGTTKEEMEEQATAGFVDWKCPVPSCQAVQGASPDAKLIKCTACGTKSTTPNSSQKDAMAKRWKLVHSKEDSKMAADNFFEKRAPKKKNGTA